MALLVLATGIASNLGELFYSHSASFGGMSGVDFGLFGYVWIEGRYNPGGGLGMSQGMFSYGIFWIVLCMTGMIGPIANAAHVVGLLSGILIAFAPYARQEFGR